LVAAASEPKKLNGGRHYFNIVYTAEAILRAALIEKL
jgi:hypothetical protein